MNSPAHTPDHDDNADDHDDFGGLAIDLPLMNRRRAMTLLGAGLVTLVACGTNDTASTSSSTSAADTSSSSSATTAGSAGASAATTPTTGDCTPIPEETAGPYPGDGSNGPNVLTESGVVRKDITTSFGDYSGTAEGVPLTVELTILDSANGCAPLAGAAVYLWHATRDGQYSLYSQGVTDQNFLRGVQEADADGKLAFTTIYPGAYDGRWPHIHFEVYRSLDDATGAGQKLVTSQLAFPEATCAEAYEADGYEQSVTNLARTSLTSDMVFSDGVDQQLATMSGSVADGYTAALAVNV